MAAKGIYKRPLEASKRRVTGLESAQLPARMMEEGSCGLEADSNGGDKRVWGLGAQLLQAHPLMDLGEENRRDRNIRRN